MRKLRTLSKLSLSIGLLTLCMGLKIAEPTMLQAVQLKLFDRYQAWQMRADEDLPVKIIDIDDASLERLGQWPWPRTELATLVQKLGEKGAAVIVFDIVFAEPDRMSPKHMQRLWHLEDDDTLGNLPDHDETFAQELAKWPVVTGTILSQQQGGTPQSKTGFAYVGAAPDEQVPAFAGIAANIPEIENASKGSGALNSDPDSDGILRRIPLLSRVGNTLYPALVVEALRVAQGAGSVIIKSVGASDEQGQGNGITAIKIGDIEVPTDAEGKFWVYFNDYRKSRYIPAWEVLADKVDTEQIAGNIILIGTSALGLKDLRATPLNPVVGGVEVHAQAIEQMLQGISLKRPDWAHGVEVLVLLACGLLALLVSEYLSVVVAFITVALLIAITMFGSWWAFTHEHLLLESVTAIITMALIYVVATVWRFAETERERGRIKSTFSLYMSEALVDELAAHPEKLKLGGERRDISIMFSDIRSFSAISERLQPEALTKFINRYLTPMTDEVMKTQGTIDKYMGDAIMAFWNAPLDVEEHPAKAVQTALSMRTALAKLNEELAADPDIAERIVLPVKTGLGINTGECSVGNMGSNQRFEYSVMGHDVDLASRLEGLCKYYGVDIILSERTKNAAGNVAVLELDKICVKGKSEALNIFALLDGAPLNENPTFQKLLTVHTQMLDAYRTADADGAEVALHECRMIAAQVPLRQLTVLYNLYETRINELRETPPPEDWDGVFVADFK